MVLASSLVGERKSFQALWLLGFFGLAAAGWAGETSELWGERGEKWDPLSRLPDFSHAGYHGAAAPLPNLPAGVSVKEFGAKGDGVTDDTQAFLDALARVKSGVIEFPAGRYRLTKILEITRPGLVLRGAGTDRTVLFFPTPLNEIRPDWGATTTGERTSNYSWSGGFVWFKGRDRRRPLATVTAEAQRGATSLQVSGTNLFQPGERIEIALRDAPDRSLTRELYSGDTGDTRNLRDVRAALVARVTRIRSGVVEFDRPLRWDVKLAWQPRINAFEPTVSEAGVEHLCLEFPNTPYRGHFTEPGYNAVAMNQVADCWARDLRILNADSGLFSLGRFCTIQGVIFESARLPEKERGATGHHGISLESDDNLFTDFDFRTRFMHDITVSGQCAGNVCAHGKGVDICFDHHKYAPYENLFTDIDIGEGSRPWQCGGGAALGKNSGARETFWNIRSQRPLAYPPSSFGPATMNLVGLRSDQAAVKEPQGKWFEPIAPESLTPQDLHAAQLARRLNQ